jgi:hypothetical protein
MSLATMTAELRGCVPGYSAILGRIHVREAWRDIRKQTGWSFQLGVGSISTAGQISAGTVTVQLGQNTVIGDTAATAAWLTAGTPLSLISQRQFRVGAGTIYNIITYDDGSDPVNSPNFPFATLTLDRLYSDLVANNNPQPTQGYTIYQPYIAAPVKNFNAWEAVCDVTNVIWLKCNASRHDRERIDRADPQRQIFSNPGTLLPYEVDQRPGSATLGFMMYELYPQPQAQYAYQTWYTFDGPELNAPTDTLPYPMSEDCVKSLARVKAYEWAEANKDSANPRGAGADFRYLMGAAQAQHDKQLKDIRMLDRDRVDLWNSQMTRITGYGPYATFDPASGEVMSRNL